MLDVSVVHDELDLPARFDLLTLLAPQFNEFMRLATVAVCSIGSQYRAQQRLSYVKLS